MRKLLAICLAILVLACIGDDVFATGNSCYHRLSVSTANNTRCSGDCNGAINLSVSGGYSPFTYRWSNGATTQDLTGLCAGTYSVTVKDKYNCAKTKTVTVYNSTPSISISASSTPNTSCTPGTCNGRISLNVTGGQSPYSYQLTSGSTTVTKQISSGNDDSEEHVSGGDILINGYHIDLGYQGSNQQIVGFRFNGVSIPAGAVITSAKLQFIAYASGSSSSNLVIKGERAANSAAFNTSNYNLSNRTVTSSTVNWNNVSSWTSGTTYNSPDITSLVNEIRANGWSSGNALTFLIAGTGERSSHSYENYSSKAAKLVITYSTGGGSSLENLCAGTYNIIVTDANGCSNTKSVAVENGECVPECTLEVNAGNDIQICSDSVATLTATSTGSGTCSTEEITDCDHAIAASGGYIADLASAGLCGDNAGAKLWTKGGNGTAFITVDFGTLVSAGTQVCVRMKLEHCSNSSSSYSSAKIQTSTSSGSGFSDLKSSETFSHTSYQEYCYTLASSARYIKVIDNGYCSFRVDYVKYAAPGTGSSTLTYLWSGPGIIGASNSASITVNKAGTYRVTATDCEGCADTDEVVVASISCCPLEVNAGPDISCFSSSANLTATSTGASACSTDDITDCDHAIAASGGWIIDLSKAGVCGDNAGAKLWTKGGEGTSYITVDFGANVPAGTQVCVSMKLEHCSNTTTGFSNAKIQASASSGSGFTDLTSSVTFTHTSFQEYCYTLSSSARYVKVIDNGNCALRVDYVKYSIEGSEDNAVTYAWSGPGIVGSNNGATISINQPGTYRVTATDCKGCEDTDEVKVLTCNDNLPCTTDLCVNGQCRYEPVVCNDQNLCTTDRCENGGCIYTPVTCNDNNACTTDGPCVNGQCQYTPVSCNDNDACTTDGPCVNGQCRYEPKVCNDNDACTSDGPCVHGQCQYTPITCNDNDACTTDGPCLNGQCQYTPITCNDNNACTTDGPCLNGQCQYTPITCNDNDACTTDGPCLNGQCQYTPVSCNDNDACTTDGPCVNGQCRYEPKVCTDNNACTTDGPCVNAHCVYTPITCNDNNACTTDGPCVNGQCQYTPLDCNDHIDCTIDECRPDIGCRNTPSSLTLDARGTNPSGCGLCDGTATVHVSGGTAPYSYSWSNGATTPTIGTGGGTAGTTSICLNSGDGLIGEFIADNYYTSGSLVFTNNTVADILGTTDDDLYRNERYTGNNSTSFSYEIPVTNGQYEIELHFAEIYFGVEGGNLNPPFTGKRLFDVSIEGVQVLNDYDINADVGPATAVIKTYAATVNDGFATIVFTNEVNRAKVNAICVKPAQSQGSGDGLCSGTYRVTVIDANGCSATDEITISNEFCDDENDCTIDDCVDNECIHAPIECNDNNRCTTEECVDGECEYTPVVCNDNNACTENACDPQTGCVYPSIVCNDNNACTTNACDPQTGCFYTPIVCDDHVSCTRDECVQGQCVYTPGEINLTVDKTDVSCDCVPSPNELCKLDFSGLQHGEIINTQYLANGVHFKAMANDPGVDTLIIFNSNVNGTQDPDLEVNIGNLAIIPLHINGGGDGIVNDPNDNIDGGKIALLFDQPKKIVSFVIVDVDHMDGDPHAIAYDGANNVLLDVDIPILGDGSVQTVLMNVSGVRKLVINTHNSIGVTNFIFDCHCCDGTASAHPSGGTAPYTFAWSNGETTASVDELCPGEYCVTVTDNKGCSKERCVTIGEEECNEPCDIINCDDQDLCTTEVCDEGECFYAPLNCRDQNPCTNDICDRGVCVFTTVTCNDNNECTTDRCENGNCLFTAVSCDDGNTCTNDFCQSGQCYNNSIPGCGDPCYDVVCNDNNACTTDACNAGQCLHTSITCNDNNECTTDDCNPSSGCVHAAIQDCGEDPCDASFCDDGNPCTVDVNDGMGGCTHAPVANTPDYLKIVNTIVNSQNIKILYGTTGAWLNQNVSGNTHLCITLRDATAEGSMSKVHVRLKGSVATEGSRITNNYPLGCVPREWTTVCLPLSLFPATNFNALPYIEIFNSAAGPYELHILKIEFTGGSTPFLWFGENHTNNYVSGNTANFNAQLVTGGPCGGSKMAESDLNVSDATEMLDISEMNVYPVPFNDMLFVEFNSGFEGKADLALIDVLGQRMNAIQVEVAEGSNKQMLSLDAALVSGIYFLEVRMNDRAHFVKVMK